MPLSIHDRTMKNFQAIAFGLSALCLLGCRPATVQTNAQKQPPVHTPKDFKAYLEKRWPVARIKEFCASHQPDSMQGLVFEKLNYGSLMHDGQARDCGRVYWYACSDDRRHWSYSVVVPASQGDWELEFGVLDLKAELEDDPAFRKDGPLWDAIWN